LLVYYHPITYFSTIGDKQCYQQSRCLLLSYIIEANYLSIPIGH